MSQQLDQVPCSWICHGLMPLRLLIYATFLSKLKGLIQPNAEWRRRGLYKSLNKFCYCQLSIAARPPGPLPHQLSLSFLRERQDVEFAREQIAPDTVRLLTSDISRFSRELRQCRFVVHRICQHRLKAGFSSTNACSFLASDPFIPPNLTLYLQNIPS